MPEKRAIWKFPLVVMDWQRVVMPQGAEILFVGAQREDICLWAKVDPKAPKEERLIRIVGTGHDFDPKDLKHLGSVLLHDGDLVFHVFE